MEQQTQTMQSSQNPDQYHHHRILLYGLGALLILFIGVGGGYLLGIKNNQPINNYAIQSQVTISPIVIPTISPTTWPIAVVTPTFIAPQISWNVTNSSLSADDIQQLKVLLASETLQKLNYHEPSSIYLSIDTITDKSTNPDEKWVIIVGVPRDSKTNEVIPTEPFNVYGNKTANGWQLISQNDSNFCKIPIPTNVTNKFFCN